jgi:hypothetical protein
MQWDIYEEAKSWQQAIAALLAFGALMAAALWNFRLNRRRDSQLRSEEAASVAAALYGEILLLREDAARLARFLAKIDRDGREVSSDFVDAYTLPEAALYKGLAPKIGLLESNLVVAITQFHRNIHEANTWLPRMMEKQGRGFSYSVLHVLEPARDAVKDIVPALRQIERLASIQTPAPDPELGLAEEVIEWEHMTFDRPPDKSGTENKS